MAKQLFGTDGMRGVAGQYPLDARTVHALGRALGEWARHHRPDPEVVIGMDTRESGPALAAQVAGGLSEAAVKVRFAGLVTTPGVAYLTRTMDFVAGVMISASHNPYRDNGIKVFDHSGFKLPDEVEHAIEQDTFRILDQASEPEAQELAVDEGLDAAYIEYLASLIHCRFDRMSVVIDCANGAASHLARPLFERLGARVHTLDCSPDGRNINLNCGALHVENVQREVLRTGADAGIAFDGDADRCMLVSHSGKIVDGDAILLIVGTALKQSGKLGGSNGEPMVVATVMSNLGLERALQSRGIAMLRTPVGDKYVLEEMVRRGAVVGGEQSGHVIFRDAATTGDGMLTALRVLEIVENSGCNLDELSRELEVYPQLLVNIRVKERKPLEQLHGVQEQIRQVEGLLGERGRVLVRFSGTEPLARIMVEGPDIDQVKLYAHQIAHAIQAELGG